jgi:SAM-dependent methyltransferase
LSFFNDSYRGVPPWDIGRPQPPFAKLAESGEVAGDVIDVGCGTGEHAILFSSRGNKVLGIDSAPLAIEKARAKGFQRGSKAEFAVADALHLARLGRSFDVAIDCGLFHTFSDGEREVFIESLRSVLRPRGRYYMLCFSDKEPVGWGGPRRVSKSEIQGCFSKGWSVDYIRPAKIDTSFHGGGGKAWFTKIIRTP